MEKQNGNSWGYLLEDWQAETAKQWFKVQLLRLCQKVEEREDGVILWTFGNQEVTTEYAATNLFPVTWAHARDRVDPHTSTCECSNCQLVK